jgi:methylthioribose-1-phosphate isomerase
MHPVIEWKDGKVFMLDQRLLPDQETYIEHVDHHQVAASIRDMAIRGAPAIGVAAGMGIALGVAGLEKTAGARTGDQEWLRQRFEEIVSELMATRPTAVNLFWAGARMRRVFDACGDYGEARSRLIEEAQAMDEEDVAVNRRLGFHGQALLESGDCVLTHCNAGALATAGYGTALGVVRAAVENHKSIRVLADETRPYLQGARLTVWELQRDGIPVTLITDSMAGAMMQGGEVQAVLVGADRIAANGDTANKIGTYSLAVLARYHQIPFYVAAPLSTIDPQTADGSSIPIEERSGEEVLQFRGRRIARVGTSVRHPAFDVTPAALITAIITEAGVLRPPFIPAIAACRS